MSLLFVVPPEGIEPPYTASKAVVLSVERQRRSVVRLGGSAGDRTRDLGLKRPLLYQLSYRPV